MKRLFAIMLLLLIPVLFWTQSDSGIAFIRIKKGEITFRKTIPPEDVRVYIMVKLQDEKDGHYQITYKVAKDKMYELDKKKINGPGEQVFKVVGGLVVLALTVLSIASHF